MFTVIVGLDASGKSRTLRPLGRRYSVMPSTLVTLRIAETGIGAPSFTANAARCGSLDDGGDGGRFAPSGGAASPLGAGAVDCGGLADSVPGGVAGGVGDCVGCTPSWAFGGPAGRASWATQKAAASTSKAAERNAGAKRLRSRMGSDPGI